MTEINDRLERIGSSMIYDIMASGGCEAYEKLVLKIPTLVNDKMERGIRLELPMMQWAADVNGWDFKKADTVRWEQDGVKYRDTPDFWIGDKILAEVKTHGDWIRKQYGAEFSEDVPDYVFCQSQFHMAANNAEECRVIASFGGEKPEVFIINFNAQVWDQIHKECTRFWTEHVDKKIPPEPKEAPLYPRMSDDGMVAATEEHLAKHEERENLVSLIKGYTEEKKKLDEYFKTAIGEKCGIIGDAMRYTFKHNKDSSKIRYKELIAEINPDPELIAKYTKIVPGPRVLRSLKPKGVK